jgi:hypothetical protein
VQFSYVNRYHNIEKARRVLGYEPLIGIEEGMKRTFDVRGCSSQTRVGILTFFFYLFVIVVGYGTQKGEDVAWPLVSSRLSRCVH